MPTMRADERANARAATPEGTDDNSNATDKPHRNGARRAGVALLDAAQAPIPTVIAGICDPFAALPYGCACGGRSEVS